MTGLLIFNSQPYTESYFAYSVFQCFDAFSLIEEKEHQPCKMPCCSNFQ